jgi:hypothetical protein
MVASGLMNRKRYETVPERAQLQNSRGTLLNEKNEKTKSILPTPNQGSELYEAPQASISMLLLGGYGYGNSV